MRWFKRFIAALVLLAAVAAFFGVRPCAWAVKLQAVPLVLKLGWLGLAVFLGIGLIGGRIYCEVWCPLGILQSCVNWVFHRKRGVRRVCTRLPETGIQIAVRWSVVAAVLVLAALSVFGIVNFGAWVGQFDPYAIFGRMISLSLPLGLIGFAIVLGAAFGKGRIWCNWVCPVGTVYALCGRFSLIRNRIGSRCGKCKACFAKAKIDMEDAGEAAKAGGVSRRDALKGVTAVVAGEKLTDGGYAPISLPGSPERERAVLPPGAGKATDFARKCVGCQLCVVNCPEKCLKPSWRLKDFGQPQLDFRLGHCRVACNRCGEVCPAGAISLVKKANRVNVHMGRAVWEKDLCVRLGKGDACTACLRKCPVNAIHLVPSGVKNAKGAMIEVPSVDAQACIGCGACEHVCPSRPLPAIRVEGYPEQRIVTPIGEGDVLAEMAALVAKDFTLVVAQKGVISVRVKGRGLAPLLTALDGGKLKDAVVVDRVIGRAAAAICIAGGAKRVHAQVMSSDAKSMLVKRGIEVGAQKVVYQILNRQKDGPCPMEKAVRNQADPVKMVAVLRKKIAEFAPQVQPQPEAAKGVRK